jgi:hypothetical protein
MQLIPAQIFRPRLIRRTAKEDREVLDVADIHGYISLAIFRKLHQVQGFIDFDRGKFGARAAEV